MTVEEFTNAVCLCVVCAYAELCNVLVTGPLEDFVTQYKRENNYHGSFRHVKCDS